MIIELHARGTPPDLVLFADTGSEFPATDHFVPLFRDWLDARSIENHIVRYHPSQFRGLPEYTSLLENILANNTLPPIAFGRHTCSIKWKISPQDKFVAQWSPAKSAWAAGERVIRYIGYDASPRDNARYAHAHNHADPLYENRYPLRSWGWARTECADRIMREGLPAPSKSSCFFCTASSASEIAALPAHYLELIVLIEALAAPRLTHVEGLWRKSSSGARTGVPKPGSMTRFVADRGLLTADRIDYIQRILTPALRDFTLRDPDTDRSLNDWLRQHFPETGNQPRKPRGGGSERAQTSATPGHLP